MADRTRTTLDHYAVDRPAEAIATAAGIGAGAGVLVGTGIFLVLWPLGPILDSVRYIFENGFSEWWDWVESVGFSTALTVSAAGASLVGLLIAVPLTRFFWPHRLRDFVRRVSGPTLHDDPAEAVQTATEELGDAPYGLEIVPGVRLPVEREVTHILISGGTGSGKGQTLLPLMLRAQARGDRCLIYDPKGEFTERLPGAILAPWDRRSLAWDIADDCRTELDAELVAKIFVPDSKSGDPMWTLATRLVMTGMLVHQIKNRGRGWGWRDLADMLELPADELVAALVESYPTIGNRLDPNSKTTASVFFNLSSFLSPIRHLAAAWPDSVGGFSVVRFLTGKTEKKILLQGSDEFGPLASRIIPSIISLLSARLLSLPDGDPAKRRIWLFLDELSSLPKIDLEPLLVRGRSKCLRLVVTMQSISQVREIYGREFSETFASNFGTQLYLKTPLAGGTAEWISSALGQIEIEQPQVTYSEGRRSISYPRITRPVVRPEDVSSLPAASRENGYFAYLTFGADVYKIHETVRNTPRRRPASNLADWAHAIDPADPKTGHESGQSIRAPARVPQPLEPETGPVCSEAPQGPQRAALREPTPVNPVPPIALESQATTLSTDSPRSTARQRKLARLAAALRKTQETTEC